MTGSGRYTIRLDLRPGHESAEVWNASTGIQLDDGDALDVLHATTGIVTGHVDDVRQAKLAALVLGGTRWPR